MTRFFAACLIWLALACPALASFTVTSLGTTAGQCGTTCTSVTISGVTIGTNQIGYAAVFDYSNTTCGTLSDGTNTWTTIPGAGGYLNSNSTNGELCVFYFLYSSGGVSSATLTYTTTTTVASMTAVVITGNATSSPLDAAVTAVTLSSGSTGSVTSGSPSVAGELFVSSFSVDSANTLTSQTFTSPPNNVSVLSWSTDGGTVINAGSGTETNSLVFAGSSNFALGVIGFKPASGVGAIFNRNFMGIGK